MGSIFASLLNSANALQVYGRTFNVIQNNITNANTPGYAQQDQALISTPFDPANGITGGLLAGPVLSSRSTYLEQAVRDQTGLLGYYTQRANDLGEVESLFNLTGSSGVPAALNTFFNSFSQLSVNPNDPVSRQNVIDTAAGVAAAFHQNAVGIQQTSNNVADEIRNTVITINHLAEQITNINKHYRANVQNTSDAGLDAQLYSTLESLSELVDFDVIRTSDGSFSVYLAGQIPLTISDHAFPISADFSAPQTKLLDAQGNDVTALISGRPGALGGQLETHNTTLPAYLQTLDAVAQAFADGVNTTLAGGVDRNGLTPVNNFFTYNAALGTAFTLSLGSITPDEIAAATATAPGGNGNAIAITQLANAPLVAGFSFTEAYGNLGGQVGRDIADARNYASAQRDLVHQAAARRDDVSGISLDEEAAKILQFQQAYQAVGKLVGVLNSLTDTIMSILA